MLNLVDTVTGVAQRVTRFLCIATVSAATASTAHASQFEQIAAGGLGDAENNYPHSMTMLDDCLFVGASRSWPYRLGLLLGGGFAGVGTGLTAPDNPQVPIEQAFRTPPAPNGGQFTTGQRKAWADDMAAKVFRHCDRGRHKGWSEVYQSRVVELADGSFWPVVHGYRWAHTYDPAGRRRHQKPAAYFGGGFGFDAESGGLSGAPLIGDPSRYVSIGNVMVRTYDGETFEEVPTPPTMGADTSMMTTIGDRFCVSSSLSPAGAVIHCTRNGHPNSLADWELVAALSQPPQAAPGFNSGVFSIEVFDGHLWAGTINDTGWQLWKCDAAPERMNPGCWRLMVAYGGGDMANSTPADLEVYRNHLYVGQFNLPTDLTDLAELKAAEIYRVNEDGDCRLVVGDRDPVSAPPADADPAFLCNRHALSGLPAGYGNPVNIYTTALKVHNGKLFAGSLDGLSFLSLIGPEALEALLNGEAPNGNGTDIDFEALFALLQPLFGLDLWVSFDGAHFVPLELGGFGNPNNFWLRTLFSDQSVLYIGAANAVDGFEIFRMRNLVPQWSKLRRDVRQMTDALEASDMIDAQEAAEIEAAANP